MLYQDLASLVADVRACNPAIEQFDCSCFDGVYITGDVSSDYLAGIEASRHDGESNGGTRLSSYQLDLGLTAVD